MARPQNKLSARSVATLAKPGRHGDGGGLYFDLSIRDGSTGELGFTCSRIWERSEQWGSDPIQKSDLPKPGHGGIAGARK
jgi:hypothetical protein